MPTIYIWCTYFLKDERGQPESGTNEALIIIKPDSNHIITTSSLLFLGCWHCWRWWRWSSKKLFTFFIFSSCPTINTTFQTATTFSIQVFIYHGYSRYTLTTIFNIPSDRLCFLFRFKADWTLIKVTFVKIPKKTWRSHLFCLRRACLNNLHVDMLRRFRFSEESSTPKSTNTSTHYPSPTHTTTLSWRWCWLGKTCGMNWIAVF